MQLLKWSGTFSCIVGASLAAIGNQDYMSLAMAMLLFSSIFWLIAAYVKRETSLLVMQLFLILVDIIGIWRWWPHGVK